MRTPEPIVFVVDDDRSCLTSVGRFLRAAGYPVMCFTSAKDFLKQRPAQARGCVVVDLRMPDMDGMTLQAALMNSDSPLPTVFLTGHGDVPTSVKAMRGGAEDFVTKTAPRELLLAAIERALTRDAREQMARTRRREVRERFASLTPREGQVLAHVLNGRLNKQIAADLGMAERSVKRHRTSLMSKLGVDSVAELVRLALEAEVGDGEPIQAAESDPAQAEHQPERG